jgi:hypothetical protein
MVDRQCRAGRIPVTPQRIIEIGDRERRPCRRSFGSGARLAAGRFGLAALVSLVLAGTLGAQERAPQLPLPPSQKCFLFLFCSLPSTPGANWQLFDRSGRLGRQGLGASPFHPEGPGNASY